MTNKRWIKGIIAALVVLGLTAFVYTSKIIENSVKAQCTKAISQYHLDCPESLILLIEDNTNSYKDRNRAIWALGQMGDTKGLPVLQKYYTGIIPEKEPYDKGISQYELKKAIHLLEGGLNITHFIWQPTKR